MNLTPVVSVSRDSDALDPTYKTRYTMHFTRQWAPTTTGIQFLSFAGAAVIFDKFVTSLQDLLTAVPQDINKEILINEIKNCRGSFTLTALEPSSGEALFLNDPLGGGFIFNYSKDALQILGSDIPSIVSLLSIKNKSLKRDPLYEISGLATGTQSYASDTPFKDLALIPPGFGMTVNPEGKIQKISYGVNEKIYSPSGDKVSDLIEAGTSVIASNVAIAAEHSCDTILTDLTGGFDSRLVLSAIRKNNLSDRISATSIRNNPEWTIAERLAVDSGMRITAWRGHHPVSSSPNTLYEQSIRGARSSGGLINNAIGPNSAPFPVINFQGGYGETFRTFSSAYASDKEPLSLHLLLEKMWQWTRLRKTHIKGIPLFTEDLFEDLVDRTSRYQKRADPFTFSNSHFSSFLYLQARNRYWVGQQSYQSCRVQSRFDPLYSLPLISAAFSLDFWSRKSNIVGLSAMKILDQNLLSLPFYNRNPITKRFTDIHGDVSLNDFPAGPVKPFKIPSRTRTFLSLTKDTYLANSRPDFTVDGVPQESVQGVQQWRSNVYDSIMSHPEIAPYFNEKALTDLLFNPGSTEEWHFAARLISTSFRAGLVFPDDAPKNDRILFQ